MNTNQIENAIFLIKSSGYERVVSLLLQYIQYYCSDDSPCDLPDSIYDFVTRGKWSQDPIVDMLINSPVSEEAQIIASVVLNHECQVFHGELDDETEELNSLVFDLLYS